MTLTACLPPGRVAACQELPSKKCHPQCQRTVSSDDTPGDADSNPCDVTVPVELASWLADALQREVSITERLQANSTASCSGVEPTPFQGSKPPAIKLRDYVCRIRKYSKCSPVCFAMAYHYIQRLTAVDEVHTPCPKSVHRLVITAVLIASKLVDDKFYSNAYYAKIGGVTTKEINRLELQMLKLLDFRVFVTSTQLSQLVAALQPAATPAGRRSKKRVSETPPPSEALAKVQHELRCSPALVTPLAPQQAISAGGRS